MSDLRSMRTTSLAERRATTQNTERSRITSASTFPDPKQLSREGGYGVNAADRKSGQRSPFKASGPSVSRGERPRTSPRSLEHRSSSRRTGGLDSAKSTWSPQASLVSSSTAPLASRISVPPLSSQAPDDLQPLPFASQSLAEQERAVLEDLLFVFMGFEGQYIRFQETYHPSEERDRLGGPDFVVQPGLDPSLRDLTQSMVRMAKHYMALESFIEVQSREEFGRVNHALCAAIRKLLKDYLTLVAQLEHQLMTSSSFTLHLINLHTKQTAHMLSHLYALAQELLKRNSMLEDDLDDSDDLSDVDQIIESLREGKDAGDVGSRKVCKGGQVLGLIASRLSTLAGDPAARILLTSLLREASRPYMNMLNEWLHRGSIRDPHAEFLIREQRSIKREGLEQDYTDEYWEKRYTIREDAVPPQLQAVKEKVLLAGKYLNVVRECGGVDAATSVKDAPLTFDDPRFLDNVQDAYEHSNARLLTLLIDTHSLPSRLRSLKHYFFLDRSDFFSYFLELSASELRKPANTVNTGKLQSLLDIVIRQPGTVAAEDPFKEDIKVTMTEVSLTIWLQRIVNTAGLDADASNISMTNFVAPAPSSIPGEEKMINGFEALTFDYAVPFPLSLVVSRVTMTRYQLLFRFLVSLQHLETLLVNSWTEHDKGLPWRHRSKNPQIEMWKRKVWTLRARMLVFVQQLHYFCSAEVIEPNWQSLMNRLRERKDDESGGPGTKRTVDELMQDHVDFLATCLKECMLTNSKLLKINAKVINTCTLFANYTSSLSRQLYAADADLSASKDSKPEPPAGKPSAASRASKAPEKERNIEHDPKKLKEMTETMEKYEYHFSRHLKMLLDMLNYLAATETVVFLGLCARLSTAAEGGGPDLPAGVS